MTDKELLELAAKAAGYEVRWHDLWKCFVHVNPHYIDYPQTMAGSRPHWVPLDDDGDALRLAVKLDLLVNVWNAANKTCVRGATADGEVEGVEMHFSDPYAATRRAIVRAAAEIGRTK